MTKEELREKRKRANESLNDIKTILGLDELYIDELEAEKEDLRDNYDQFRASAIPEIERLQNENKELKADNDARKFAMAMSEKVEKQLREENEELKETVTKMNNVITETFSNLSKAKEIITELLKYTDTEAVEMIKEAKQFITDSEVEK